MGRSEETREEVPTVTSLGPYQFQRSSKDVVWGVAFGVAYVGVLLMGVLAWHNRNPLFSKIDQGYLNDPKHCPLVPPRLLLEKVPEAPAFDISEFMAHAAIWLAVSCALSVVLGALFLRAFQHLPDVMTRATVYAQVLAPALAGGAMLGAGQGAAALLPLALAGLTAFVFFLWRDQIGLAARLLGVSAHGLAANPHLITLSVALSVASVVAALPLAAALALLLLNGDVVPNPGRDLSLADTCVDASGQVVLCCAWRVRDWVKIAAGAGLLVLLWAALLANQIRVYVVSGAIAQWYFAAPGDGVAATRGSTLRSLRHALGPSFGSLALGSLVLAVTETLQNAAQRNSDEQQDVVSWVLACLASCLAAIIEYLTKFATVFMAITGDAFFVAGRRVTDLLSRNFLDAFASTIWFTPMVIQLAGLGMSVAWGAGSGGVYYLLHRRDTTESAVGTNAVVLGVLAGLAALFVLNFLGGVLLAVLDAAFVCWALDRDTATVSQPGVAQAFESVPLKTPDGALVQQPGGGVAYAGLPTDAPSAQRLA